MATSQRTTPRSAPIPRRGAARRIACRAGVLMLVPLAAGAATESTTFAVTATVVSTCGVAASPLSFGVYAMGQTDSTTSVVVTCTNGTNYTVSLDAGTGSGASVAVRRLTGPASQTLGYSLYSNAGRTTVWGDTIGLDTVAGSGTGTAQTLTVYGRVPAAQGAGAGAYADTVTVTLTY